MNIIRHVRPYAIIRCLAGCTLTFNEEESIEIEGEEIKGLRALVRRHCKETGHITEFDLTLQTRYLPEGVELP